MRERLARALSIDSQATLGAAILAPLRHRAAARMARRTPHATRAERRLLDATLPSGLRRLPFDLRIAPGAVPAFTFGVWTPRVVLPGSLMIQPAAGALVLAHELHHVRSRDFVASTGLSTRESRERSS